MRIVSLLQYFRDAKIHRVLCSAVMDSYFFSRFRHPVTFAGMLEMGTTYLPVNGNWFDYINRSNEVYNKLQREANETLMTVADEACMKVEDKRFSIIII